MSHSRLFLIDAHALCYRSFFAIKNLSTSYGQPTNAVFGFLSTLRKILREYEPEYMAVCFDVGKKTLRQERYAEYKIHRKPMPDDLISQIPLIKEAVKAYNLPIFELEGFEADDVIATLATKMGKDLDVVIVSGDKDMMQLLNNHVKIFNVHKDRLMGYKEAKEDFGIDPKNITDYLGLAGDQSDNIPGVFGVGEVTARDLINQFGTIENMFSEIDQVASEKLKEKLLGQKEQAIFSKELATLDANVPLKFGLDALKVTKPDQEKLLEFFRKLEFRKLADELAASEPTNTGEKLSVKTLKNADDIQSLTSKIGKQKAFAFLLDCAKESESLLSGGIAVSLGKEAFYVPSEEMAQLKSVFEDEKILKITHNVKEAVKTLRRQGIEFAGGAFDCMLAAYLIAPSKGLYDVETLAWDTLKYSLSVQANLGERAKCVFDLYAVLKKELEEKSLLKLFEEIEIPLAFVLSRMEEEGVRIDEKLLASLSKECDKKIEDLNTRLYKMAGMEFNLNSPKQLSEVLFQKLKLPAVKKTKTGFSTDEGVLAKLAEKHEFPALILEYRQLAKLKSTYIDSLPKLIDPKTGRIHASFNQVGTETGRLSSNDPNLQNIPIRTELGRQIRKAFICRGKGYIMISADYSQIELRILAHLSGDKNLIKAFKSDEDIHTFTSAQIFEVKEDKVTPDMRNAAKRINFGIIYGMSAFGLSKDLKISVSEAQDFIDRYFLRYPGIKKFMDEEIKKAEKNGYVLTLMNRRRYLPEIHNSNMMIRQFAQRQAVNTPVQGSAADLMKLAMIKIQDELSKKAVLSRMIITVHDELVFDVPEKEKALMAELIRRQMENTVSLSVPIKVSIKAGENWLNMKEL